MNAPDVGIYKELLLFLGTAGIIVPLFSRLKLSPVLGFLAAGIVLGPFGLGMLARENPWVSFVAITNVSQIMHLAEFGVAFLLFMIALELSWERLWGMRKLVFGLGGLQVVISSIALALIAFGLGETPGSAAVLGSALAMSSTAIILPSLAERKRLNTTAGRASFAVLLFQDLSVAPLLFMVAALGAREGGGLGPGLLYALAPAALALVAIFGVGRLLLRPFFHLVAATGSSEAFVAGCLFIVIATGVVTAASGQSMAIGAFIAGLLLAETEYRRQIEVTIQPFQGLLLGLFFVSVGASLDLSQVINNPLPTLAVVAAFLAVKFTVLFPTALVMGLARRPAAEVATVLSPGGEFALVLVGAAVALHVVPPGAAAIATVAATLTMCLIPLVVHGFERVASRARESNSAVLALTPQTEQGSSGHVIVIGFGRVGRLVGEMLAQHDIRYLAIDMDADLVAQERKQGLSIYYGDATRIELLRRCGIRAARGLVVTLDTSKAIEDIVSAARAERADLMIVARAHDAKHATRLYGVGVTDAVPETIEASLQLSEAVLVNIGVPMGLVIASIHAKRDKFRRMLQPSDTDQGHHSIRASTSGASPKQSNS